MKMRQYITIMENRQADFLDYMIDAATQCKAGFHFEEGGCWGMALALRDTFDNLGEHASLAVYFWNGSPSHAMASVNGELFDHQGKVYGISDARVVDETRFLQLAQESGWSLDDVQSYRAWATEIITLARKMAQDVQ